MTAPFDTSVICPTLVGRAPQLDALYRLVAQAADGQGQIALSAGEAGVGKSRLVAEVKGRAQRSVQPTMTPQGTAHLRGL